MDDRRDGEDLEEEREYSDNTIWEKKSVFNKGEEIKLSLE